MRIKLLSIIVLCAVIAGGLIYFTGAEAKQTEPESAQVPPPMPVDVVKVSVKDVEISRELSGRTSPYKVAEIRPQVSGIIQKRFFTEGSIVNKGDQLYQIDPATYITALASAKAELLQAEAQVLASAPRAKRYEKLLTEGGISQQTYDDALAALRQAEAAVAGAEAAVTAAQINLDYTKVLSPITGRIGKSSVTEGALVTANQQSALAKVQTLEKIYVDVQQSGAEIRNLRKEIEQGGKAVQLFVEGDSKPYAYEGEFQFADFSVDETTGMVNVRILFPNPEMELLPGFFVKAKIMQQTISNAVLVPQRAVMRTPEGSAVVWTVSAENKVVPKPIVTDRAFGKNWIVNGDLKDGEMVMVNGFQKTGPGAVVSPIVTEADK